MNDVYICVKGMYGKKVGESKFTLVKSKPDATVFNLSHDSGEISHVIGWLQAEVKDMQKVILIKA